ncbi:MAG TPA: PPK2 family polyphosphate kinase [Flavisolibacter sp.]|nr:PPK2 family polyphosphate kinase [Flavisolibacter sp.]
MALLKDISTRSPKELDKATTKEETTRLHEQLEDLQYLLFAESKHAVLVIFQGLDASGKDGTIKNTFSCMNPQGVSVQSFKAPTAEELSHDFLWRIHRHAPAKGMIQVFNRSHYEDVLVTRVHGWCDDETAQQRFKAINHFEKLLQVHNNTTILKFYLHVSPERQQERLKERTEDPKKGWKYNAKDFDEAKLWDKYIQAYEDVFEHCSEVPWTIVPADHNWYKEYIVAKKLKEALSALNMTYPKAKEA